MSVEDTPRTRAENIAIIVRVTNWLLTGGGERNGEHHPDLQGKPQYDYWTVEEAARTHPSAQPARHDIPRTGLYFGRTVSFYPPRRGEKPNGIVERRIPTFDVADCDTGEWGTVHVALNKQGVEVVVGDDLERRSDADLATLARILGSVSAFYEQPGGVQVEVPLRPQAG